MDEQLAQGDVPPDVYRFSPPAGAQDTGAICNGPLVGPAAAAYGGVTPLLSPVGTGGLRLQDLFSLQSPADAAATTTYLYQPKASSSQALLVIVRHGGTVDAPTDGTVIVPSLATTVAGRRVRGTLVRTLPTFDEYTFRYAIGGTTIAIKGTNLGLPGFMRILGALVDGHGTAALQTRLQHDLSAAAQGVPVAAEGTGAHASGAHHLVRPAGTYLLVQDAARGSLYLADPALVATWGHNRAPLQGAIRGSSGGGDHRVLADWGQVGGDDRGKLRLVQRLMLDQCGCYRIERGTVGADHLDSPLVGLGD